MRPMLAFVAIAIVAACDQLGLGPPAAEPAPAPAAAPPDLRPLLGQTYDQLYEAQPGYAPAMLGLTATDAARFAAAMREGRPSWIVSGGGKEVLVFTGCADLTCHARGVLAIDMATGAAFAGVSDAQGATELAQNDGAEALLRLNSPTRDWADTQPPAPGAPRAAP